MTDKYDIPITDSPTPSDLDQWRREIHAFFRKTLSHLQDIARDEAIAAEALARQHAEAALPPDDNPPEAVTERPAEPTESRTAASTPVVAPDANPVKPTTKPSSTSLPESAPRDLDSSQDRLANLKRQLAAKLSKVASDDENLK